MIEIDDKIVSLDLLRECFVCDLGKCRGICCVEGSPREVAKVEESYTGQFLREIFEKIDN